ncbi:MAG: hypothetical protein AB7F98_07380 [Novosphingobium sp.]
MVKIMKTIENIYRSGISIPATTLPGYWHLFKAGHFRASRCTLRPKRKSSHLRVTFDKRLALPGTRYSTRRRPYPCNVCFSLTGQSRRRPVNNSTWRCKPQKSANSQQYGKYLSTANPVELRLCLQHQG